MPDVLQHVQRVHRDTEKVIQLWGLGHDGNLTLTFTSDQLKDAGYDGTINIFDLQSVFQCNVTIAETNKQTVYVKERKERFLKPL